MARAALLQAFLLLGCVHRPPTTQVVVVGANGDRAVLAVAQYWDSSTTSDAPKVGPLLIWAVNPLTMAPKANVPKLLAHLGEGQVIVVGSVLEELDSDWVVVVSATVPPAAPFSVSLKDATKPEGEP